ncbi:MAG TPA: cation:proton antiporter [Candidatus Limnocylindria bacterium]|nr:cation:proton antiporter [Candidatus Limnocylindria bacterium]
MDGTASHDQLLNDLALCVVVAWGFAVVAKLIRQPLIVAYLLAGVLVGPVGLGWIADREAIATISELGLIFLLFMIGLEIDLKKVLTAGKAILVTSIVQVVGGALLGVIFFKLIGFSLGGGKLDAVYLAVAAALSSTVVIVKILHDKRELDTLAGRITLGVLVIQDLFAILFLAVQPDLNHPSFAAVGLSLFKVAVLVAAALVASKYALPPLFRAVARLPELVLVGALAWCFLVCGLATALGLSREMGALIAGVAISTFPYALDVTAKVTSLRDFFLTIFFVALGMTIPKPDWALLGMALVFSGFLIVSRFITVFFPLHRMNLGHRVSFLPALSLSQVSEFSLVIVALGQKLQHVSETVAGVVAYAFAFLAVDTSYAMMKSEGILRRASPWLARLGLRDYLPPKSAIETDTDHIQKRIYFLGFFSTASSLLEELSRHDAALLKDIAVVDFNPLVNTELRRRGIPIIYGDISQRETLLHAGVAGAEILICTIPNSMLKGTSNLRLVQQLREINPSSQIIAPAEFLSDVPKLYAAGASFVSVPRMTEAKVLRDAVIAARENRLHHHREELHRDLHERQEVIS